MNLLQFVPVKLTIFLVIGIVLGYHVNTPPSIGFLWVICGLAALAFLHFRKKRHLGIVFGGWVFFTSMGLGFLSISMQKNLTYNAHLNPSELEVSHLWKLQIREQLKSSQYYHRYLARVEGIDSIRSNGLILCRTPAVDQELKPGNRLLLYTQAKEIAPPKNPHQFNYRKYLQNMGIAHQISFKSEGSILIEDSFTLRGKIGRFRYKILEQLGRESFGDDELGIIKALLLGDRRSVTHNTYENYKDAGAVHILAVSGLHIGIILILLEFILKPVELLRRGRGIKLLTIVLLLWSYAFLAGLSASVIRAVTMFTFVAYATYLNRPGISFNVLALSVFFILLFIDPFMLFQVGFQLSYSAVLSILWAYPKILAVWKPGNTILMKLWQLFAVGMAAQPGVLPLGLYYFHQFPGLFFISNLTLVPFLGVILLVGLLTVVLSLAGILPDTLVLVYNTMIKAMNSITAWIAGKEAFLFKGIYFDGIHLILSYVILGAIVAFITKPRFTRLIILSCCILLIQCWNIALELRMNRKNTLVIFHQVGETVLAYRQGYRLNVFADSTAINGRLLEDYKTGEGVRDVHFEMLKNSYHLARDEFLVVNEPDQLIKWGLRADILLLSDAPRINLDRYLSAHKPRLIIADGSNYKSFVQRWQKSCNRYDVPFHNTAIDGALELDLR